MGCGLRRITICCDPLPFSRGGTAGLRFIASWSEWPRFMLRGYGKRSGKEFPCAPKDICHEWDWDVNPYFKDNPRLLGDYRKIFEPQWNPALAAVRAERMSSEDKFVLAGYWALLSICTPTWHRNAVDVADRQLADFIPLAARHLANEKPEYRDFVEEALCQGLDQAKPGRTTHQGHPYAASYPDSSSPLPARLGCASKHNRRTVYNQRQPVVRVSASPIFGRPGAIPSTSPGRCPADGDRPEDKALDGAARSGQGTSRSGAPRPGDAQASCSVESHHRDERERPCRFNTGEQARTPTCAQSS